MLESEKAGSTQRYRTAKYTDKESLNRQRHGSLPGNVAVQSDILFNGNGTMNVVRYLGQRGIYQHHRADFEKWTDVIRRVGEEVNHGLDILRATTVRVERKKIKLQVLPHIVSYISCHYSILCFHSFQEGSGNKTCYRSVDKYYENAV